MILNLLLIFVPAAILMDWMQRHRTGRLRPQGWRSFRSLRS